MKKDFTNRKKIRQFEELRCNTDVVMSKTKAINILNISQLNPFYA
ncbi:hypothetical protein SAMN05444412_10875 [Rhodonellum ikkaensis]|uniref:Uncharacterized protein n=1 Tax=Rhodonellum ikkaensis TaxID=336829 RepID=A0A1H3RGR7_9BACT|nr:hypothetical protein SAMN05444412_10875 [Rhodonellum ikkaensis]